MSSQLSASLDASGKICDWQYELWSGSHNERPGNAGKLIPAQLLAKPFIPARRSRCRCRKAAATAMHSAYTLPRARIVNHFLPVTPLRTSAMRSLGAHINLFAIEGMMDELAASAQADRSRFACATWTTRARAKSSNGPRASSAGPGARRRATTALASRLAVQEHHGLCRAGREVRWSAAPARSASCA
jgi:CO/xanthine dehydrogenase Mo-binding subunit